MSVVLAIITIVGSGVVAAVVAYRLNATKEQVFFLRQKAEALYLAIERYDRTLSAHFLGYYSLLQNEISYDDLLDIQTSRKNDDNGSGAALETATMLINVYFPNLIGPLNAYTSARGGVHKVLAEHNKAYKQGDIDGTRWLDPFHTAMLKLEDDAQALKHAVLTEAVAFASADRLWPWPVQMPTSPLETIRSLWRAKTKRNGEITKSTNSTRKSH